MIERELRAHLCASLQEMPSFVEAALAQLPSEMLARVPDCDRSPLLEHAWHLRDCDEDLYAMRIRRAVAEDQPFRRASRWLSPQSCSLWLNILAVKRCRNDRVALWIERDGGDGRPVAGST